MARTATEDTTVTESEETKTRKRVDPATLDPNEKVLFGLNIPAGMRVAIRTKAEEQNVSEAQFVRDMVAAQIGYTVPDSFSERRGRVGKFSNLSPEEKAAKLKEEAETKRKNVSALLGAIASGAIDIEKLKELGIDPDLLPKPRDAKDDE